MKKLMLMFVLCVLGTLAVLPQSGDQIVRIKRHYYLGEKPLNGNELKTILKNDQASADLYKKSTKKMTAGLVFLGIGTAFIGYAALNPPKENSGGLPGLISDEEMQKWMKPVYASLGCIALSIPFLISGSKNGKQSIEVYNSNHKTGYNRDIKIDIGFTPNGAGLLCRF
jgi:hypothetical protein